MIVSSALNWKRIVKIVSLGLRNKDTGKQVKTPFGNHASSQRYRPVCRKSMTKKENNVMKFSASDKAFTLQISTQMLT